LASLAWVDEIVVMDLRSTDGSVALARRYGARVVERDPLPVVEPLRNEVAAQAGRDWILALDPDERVTPGLAAELSRLAERDDLDAVVLPRMNLDFGFAPSGCGQRYEGQLRMYRRDRVSWPAFPNRLPAVPADRIHRIEQRDDLVLAHDRNRNLPEALERAQRYAPAEAQAMLGEGRSFSAPLMAEAVLAAIDRHVFRARAWRDGMPGIARAAVLVNYKVSVWLAFWQLSETGRTPSDDRFIATTGRVLLPPWRVGWAVARRVLARAGRLRRPS
jgi:glycosyltransferase involved in cell wall biosynthesis